MTLSPIRLGWLLLSATLYILIAYNIPREQFSGFFGLNLLLVWGYWLRVREFTLPGSEVDSTLSIDYLLFAAALLFRLLLLVASPQLSDEHVQFIWDGRLVAHGINPYLYLPGEIVDTPIALKAGVDQALFTRLPSSTYYPPVSQVFFAMAAWVSSTTVASTVFWLRVPIVLAEIGSLWLMVQLLKRFGKNPNLALLYGLNPLTILELTGNVHIEAIMIFFTLLAIWLVVKNQRLWIWSAGALSLAIGTKLLPIILLPFAIRHFGWQQGLRYIVLTGLLVIVQFVPFASPEVIQNMSLRLNLYSQPFGFNASIYYLIRAIGYWSKSHIIIAQAGFWLAIISILSILWLAFTRRNWTLSVRLVASLTIYYALTTTVYPWSAISLVAIAVFTSFRYLIVWSALLPLSYAMYSTLPYQENLTLTAIEYGVVVLVLIWEWRNRATTASSPLP